MNGVDLPAARSLGMAICLCLAALDADAALSPAQAATERARIARERAEVESTFAAQEAKCQEGFVVTPCMDAARKAQRDGLARLRRQEVLLDEEQRKIRAAERMQSIRGNTEAQAARAEATAAASAPQAKVPARVERSPRSPPQAAQERRTGAAERAQEAAVRRSQERENIERYEARQQEAQAHRNEVEERNATRLRSGKKAAPLPSPPASSAGP